MCSFVTTRIRIETIMRMEQKWLFLIQGHTKNVQIDVYLNRSLRGIFHSIWLIDYKFQPFVSGVGPATLYNVAYKKTMQSSILLNMVINKIWHGRFLCHFVFDYHYYYYYFILTHKGEVSLTECETFGLESYFVVLFRSSNWI